MKDYSVEQAEFFAACGEFPYTPDSSIAVRCLDEKFRDFYRNVPYVIDPLQGYDAEAIAVRTFVLRLRLSLSLVQLSPTSRCSNHFYCIYVSIHKSMLFGSFCVHQYACVVGFFRVVFYYCF